MNKNVRMGMEINNIPLQKQLSFYA